MNRSPELTHADQSTTAQEPEHAYDAPGLTATQFIAAVMHDPTVQLHMRIDAAGRLLHILYRDPEYVQREIAKGREPAFTYRIEGIKVH
jgi:hypothetical protein